MKALLLIALAVSAALLCSPRHAHGYGRLSIYSDPALSQCTLSDTSPGVANIYVAEWSDYGATGLRFRIAESAGFTGTWLSETSPFVTLGNSRTDLSIGFGLCLVDQFLVLTMTYQFYGTSACSNVSIAPPEPFPVVCTGCQFDEQPCIGFDPLHVNCSDPVVCYPVAAEPSTWGRVKALYRN